MISKIMMPLLALAAMAGTAVAGDAVRVVGSSTVYPFSTAVAEKFGKEGHTAPIIESTGTGGGFKLFCSGTGNGTPDIANASRKIKESELEICAKNGVKDPIELKIGKDALAIGNSKDGPKMGLTLEQIYLALAKQIPVDGKLVDNPNQKWSDIDPNLPDMKIEVLGPPPTSGTRDSFVELAMHPTCKAALKSAGIKLEGDAEKAACNTMREDGRFIEAGENDNLIVQKLSANPNALGIFGFSFLDNSGEKIQDVTINGVEASFETAVDGSYPLSRDLFVYVKREHIKSNPELLAFATELVSEDAIGDDGYLLDKGLIVETKEEREAQRAKLK